MNSVEPQKDLGQGTFTIISLPINEDHVAIGHAISDLLKEGWSWRGIDKIGSNFYVVVCREWRA